MIAVPLILGSLSAESYTGLVASDPRIDVLRAKMIVKEDPVFTHDYFDPGKRAIPNRVQIFFKDGSSTDAIQVDYPLGHARRRDEAKPFIQDKALKNITSKFGEARAKKILAQCVDPDMVNMPVSALLTLFTA
jgi:2-methylcitrate dehydratase